MPKLTKRKSKTPGLPPGTLVHVGERKTHKVKITVIDYDDKKFQQTEMKDVDECSRYKDTATVTWINMDGIHEIDLLKALGESFTIHSLVLEDILNTGQRPKMDDYEDYLFIVMKMFYFDEEKKEIIPEHISLILGHNFVISFQEAQGDVFNPVRERLEKNYGRIRKMGADYLTYALMDAVVDNYFVIMEKQGENIEVLEEIYDDPHVNAISEIHRLRRELIYLRKSIWPLREVINIMQRQEHPLIKKGTRVFLRDLYDHLIQVVETIETYREMATSLLDLYLSSISNRMNEVMKVLTIIATIFIPLSFIAGVYGMNFRYMPELEWRYGYLYALALMLAVALVLLGYFKRKEWF